MKKRFSFLYCLSLFFYSGLFAQKFPVALGPSINHAIGEFTTTHSIGIGIECSSAKHWFEFKKGKKIGFTWKGGYTYCLSKKITTSSFPDLYSGYSFIHAFAGLQINPMKKTLFRLFAGPGLGIYSGNTRFIIASELDASYLIRDKFAAGPLIILIKEAGADAIWSIGLKGIFKL